MRVVPWPHLSVAVLWLLGACGDEPPTGAEPVLSIQPAPTGSGDNQTDTVLATLAPFRVLVQRGTTPAQGVTVRWTVPSDVSVPPRTTTTDASGIASLRLTFDDIPRTYTVLASVDGATGSPVTFTAIATAAAGRTLGFTVQPTSAAGAQPLTPAVQVTVQDASGNTVPTATSAVTLALGTNPGGATLFGITTVDAVSGIATFTNLRVDRPGSGYTLVASAAGLSGATSAPFAVTLTFAAVSAGQIHTCGVTTAGAAYCWGANDHGQLGDGTTTGSSTPVLVAGGVSFAAVSGGAAHSCGVTAVGAAYCWGLNFSGQLGDGTTTDRLTPVLVAGGVSFAAVSTHFIHTCGVTAAGAAYCWGNNVYGKLGDGTTSDRSTPALVAGGVSFAAVSAGESHTCGVTAAGAAYCWGYGGRLGDGTETVRLTPVLVAGGVSFAAVSAGSFHTCGVTAAGAAYCWGTTPVLVAGGVSFAAVSAGGYHTCGVTAAGAAYCWGTTPVLVAGGVSFAAVSAGDQHTCGVTAAGAAYCWGANFSGQLGDGTTIGRLTPVRVVQ